MNHAVFGPAVARLDFQTDERILPEQLSWGLFLNLDACRNQIPIKQA